MPFEMGESTVPPGIATRLMTRLPRPAVLSKFAFTGALVALVHLCLVSLLVLAGLPIQIALAMGYVVALAFHFTMNRQWVFSAEGGYVLHISRQGARYLALAGFSYAVTATAVAVLPDLIGVHELVAFVASTLGMAAVSFVLLHAWVFRAAPGGTA